MNRDWNDRPIIRGWVRVSPPERENPVYVLGDVDIEQATGRILRDARRYAMPAVRECERPIPGKPHFKLCGDLSPIFPARR